MSQRTGLEWSPERRVSDDIRFNIEGNLFRNKARVLSSMLLIDPLSFKSGLIKPTQFGRALSAGLIAKEQFYKEIIQRFAYPHPAYDENWQAWKQAGITLRPLLFIMDILVHLAEINPDQAYLTTSEFAEFGHSHPFQKDSQGIAQSLLHSRNNGQEIRRQRSDRIERKINDIFGFLCMSQFCYYDKTSIRLNLIGISPVEKVHFVQKRNDYDTLKDMREFVNQALERN